MPNIAIYARYSSDQQSESSIEDQIRLCRLHAERQGWRVVETYCDHAISGASLIRPGIQAALTEAGQRKFDLLLAESIDRISRDQEDIAGVYKRMLFAGVKMVTVSEGDISELHIGLKGTMGALYLKDLADKTRRGLRGRVEKGKSGGGNSFGYTVVKKMDAAGNPIRGERAPNPDEAQIVCRIFEAYAAGKSARAIAMELNSEGVPGPAGGAWGPSTIHGNAERGTGILNNELYVGRLVWNRLRYIKDPDTGKRVSRLNPPDEWVVQEVPDLRIVDQDVWERVKARQADVKPSRPVQEGNPLGIYKRPRYLLSGFVKCGVCGGGYSTISKHHLGCSTARNKGTCDNLLTIRRDRLEADVLTALDENLMDPGYFEAFCEEYTRHINRVRMEAGAELTAKRNELDRVKRELDKLVQAIIDGAPVSTIKDRMQTLEDRKEALTRELATAEEPPTLIHPNMAKRYHDKLGTLYEALSTGDAHRDAAAEALRELIDRVTLSPEDGRLRVQLVGDLAGMLSFAAGKNKPAPGGRGGSELAEVQVPLVAGAGFEPATFRL